MASGGPLLPPRRRKPACNSDPKISMKLENCYLSISRGANIYAAQQSFICNLAIHADDYANDNSGVV